MCVAQTHYVDPTLALCCIRATTGFVLADAVYMERSDWRDEYVLNDTGKLYRGDSNMVSCATIIPTHVYMVQLLLMFVYRCVRECLLYN